ncbi:MAG TPA: hypothetical protein VJR89_31190 [Polyangiales bacterium]|nr:hypothetical protein [Polyangiales bacterium]
MRLTVLLTVLAALSGCGSDDPAGSTQTRGQPVGAACSPINLTQPCACADGSPGRQTCKASGYAPCECAARASASPAAVGGSAGRSGGPTGPSAALATDPPANRSSVRFDWQRTVPTGGSCEAGHYEGTFTGWYSPAIIVVPDLPVIPVFPVELPGNPGLAFDLLREGNGEIFTVSNGKMNGNALGAFPFSADVVGKLNCETKKFDAMLVNGSYFIGPLEYKFAGPITAEYDKLTHTMINGVWKVDEPDAPGSGGAGDWTIKWVRN